VVTEIKINTNEESAVSNHGGFVKGLRRREINIVLHKMQHQANKKNVTKWILIASKT
jgi:hypothetical protein